MPHSQNINIQEENDFKKIVELIFKKLQIIYFKYNYLHLVLAFLINRYSIPIYSISSSILIKKGDNTQPGED